MNKNDRRIWKHSGDTITIIGRVYEGEYAGQVEYEYPKGSRGILSINDLLTYTVAAEPLADAPIVAGRIMPEPTAPHDDEHGEPDITRYCGHTVPDRGTCLRPLRHDDGGHVYTDPQYVPDGAAEQGLSLKGQVLAADPHGPLAAHLSDRTMEKVLSRPAHVPSLVMLDRHAAAQHLADVALDVLTVIMGGGIGPGHPQTAAFRQALADYRETTA